MKSSDRGGTAWYETITLGYSDSEDRMWIRLTRRDSEAMLWVTRRLVAGLLPAAFKVLVRNAPLDDSQQAAGGGDAVPTANESMARSVSRHREIVKAAAAQKPTPAPARPSADKPAIQLGMLSTIDIKTHRDGIALVFRGSGDPVGFRCGRDQAHRLLQAFWDRQKGVGWGIPQPWEIAAPADTPPMTAQPDAEPD